jgi:farnesyl diphosphate synthase
MMLGFEAWREEQLARVESALDGFIAAVSPADLGLAMRYGVLGGGKRLRALLVLAASDAVQGNSEAALRGACAVELIHAYSLIHDDMPCMDNDVLRRGKPTVHVAFGEAQALLAGDALQALAFEILTTSDASVPDAVQAAMCRLLARASGVEGMAGGQAIDLASIGKNLSEAQLRKMHQLKTGALLQAAVDMGYSTGVQANVFKNMSEYGAAVGLAFQVVDDILDVTADAVTLGKTVGKDAEQNKPTYVALMGLDAAEKYANALLDQALNALNSCKFPNDQYLRELATQLVKRKF